MKHPFIKPEFEDTPRRRDGTTREQQELAAKRLVEVLELAEALPYEPKDELDLPARQGSS